MIKLRVKNLEFRVRKSQPATLNSEPRTLETEVDRILDKVAQQGMESLTTKEKQILDKHSQRLRGGNA
ncbi:MAG: hypothetical protein HY400_06000 [Elusimicrobia bacterium]|nr:hypothetical protein [Elusimicrobiota bacterium]